MKQITILITISIFQISAAAAAPPRQDFSCKAFIQNENLRRSITYGVLEKIRNDIELVYIPNESNGRGDMVWKARKVDMEYYEKKIKKGCLSDPNKKIENILKEEDNSNNLILFESLRSFYPMLSFC